LVVNRQLGGFDADVIAGDYLEVDFLADVGNVGTSI
jgi:hypothetical protein